MWPASLWVLLTTVYRLVREGGRAEEGTESGYSQVGLYPEDFPPPYGAISPFSLTDSKPPHPETTKAIQGAEGCGETLWLNFPKMQETGEAQRGGAAFPFGLGDLPEATGPENKGLAGFLSTDLISHPHDLHPSTPTHLYVLPVSLTLCTKNVFCIQVSQGQNYGAPFLLGARFIFYFSKRNEFDIENRVWGEGTNPPLPKPIGVSKSPHLGGQDGPVRNE